MFNCEQRSPQGFDNFAGLQDVKETTMESTIRDLAIDLGVFALDNELENGRTLATHSAAPTTKNNTAYPTEVARR